PAARFPYRQPDLRTSVRRPGCETWYQRDRRRRESGFDTPPDSAECLVADRVRRGEVRRTTTVVRTRILPREVPRFAADWLPSSRLRNGRRCGRAVRPRSTTGCGRRAFGRAW